MPCPAGQGECEMETYCNVSIIRLLPAPQTPNYPHAVNEAGQRASCSSDSEMSQASRSSWLSWITPGSNYLPQIEGTAQPDTGNSFTEDCRQRPASGPAQPQSRRQLVPRERARTWGRGSASGQYSLGAYRSSWSWAALEAAVPSCTKRSTQSTFWCTSLNGGPCTWPPRKGAPMLNLSTKLPRSCTHSWHIKR